MTLPLRGEKSYSVVLLATPRTVDGEQHNASL
jgi:hypothetical protein